MIELPEQICSSRDSQVSVSALAEIRDITSVEVEPLTVEDWEMLEVHAGWLENGGLLSQITVVYPNQVLRLVINGGTDTATIRVVKTGDSTWEPCACGRLVAKTEIHVQPKPRHASRASVSLRLLPCSDDYSLNMIKLAERENITLPVVAPSLMAVHPSTLGMLDSAPYRQGESIFAMVWKDDDEEYVAKESIAVLKVSVRETVARDHAGKSWSTQEAPKNLFDDRNFPC